MEWTFSDSVRLSLLSFSEASKACAALPGFSLFRRSLQPERIEYCRAELLPDCLVGSLAVPDKTHPLHLAFSLAFYLDRGQLILAADEQTLPALQSLLFPEEPLDTSDVFHLFFSFLESLIQEDMLAELETTLEGMDLGPLLGLWLQSSVIGLTMQIMGIIIFVLVYGRMIEIYLMTSLAPLPVATLSNRELGSTGQNYLKSLFAVGFQGMLILVCVAIYAVLVQGIATGGDPIGAIWGTVGYTVLLCFMLFKTGGIAQRIFGAH